MFEKLKDASSYLIIPSVALYLAGFMCVTGYLAHFGIITFDIVNARFLIAGAHAALALTLCVISAWEFWKIISVASFWGAKNAGGRTLVYALFLFLPQTLSTLLNGLYSLWSDTPSHYSMRFFSILGKYDPIGAWLARQRWITSSDNGWIVGFASDASAYLLLLFVVGTLIAGFIRKVRAAKQRVASVPDQLNSMTASTNSTEVVGPPVPPTQVDKTPAQWIIATMAGSVDLVFLVIAVVLFIYSSLKVSSGVFGSASLSSSNGVDASILWAWLYSTTALCIVFFASQVKDKSSITAGFQSVFSRPEQFQIVLQLLLIPIIGSVFTFGADVFPRIPFALGGGQPREVRIVSVRPATLRVARIG